MYFVGIDVGTSSIKMVLMDELGSIKKIATRNYPINMFGVNSEQNPLDWYDACIDGLKELSTCGYEDIEAISFSGQMHGLVVLDEAGNVIRPAILWNDQRTSLQCEYLNKVVGRDKLLKHTANIALTGFTAPKILWMRENELENFKRIKKIMLPKDYLVYRLTGNFVTDFSDASGTLILDVKNKRWSKFMMNLLGIDESNLPEVHESFDCIGTLSKEASMATKLSPNTKIVIGGGDQAVGAVGTGTVLNGMCTVSLGTSGVVFLALDDFKLDESEAALHSFCHANGNYHMMGVTLSAAASFKWWLEDILNSKDYEKEQIINEELGENIFFLPYLQGERTPINDPMAKGAFIGLTSSTTRSDMSRAVMEGVAYSLYSVLKAINQNGVDVNSLRIIGGGAKSDAWCQIVANVFGIETSRINSVEGPAFGAAILAAVGAGKFESVFEATSKLIKVTETFSPNKVATKNYAKKFQIYESIYDSLVDVFNLIGEC